MSRSQKRVADRRSLLLDSKLSFSVKVVMVRARQRPGTASMVVDRTKLHRHYLVLAGRPYTVVTLRPGTDARFSTNFYHDTWHILSDWHGARLLGRLLWGLAYQRRPGTLVLIGPPFINPNPFDGTPGDPIALVPNPITNLTPQAATELRRRLPLAGNDGTLRWLTHGLDTALCQLKRTRDRPPGMQRRPPAPWRGFQERMDRIGGILTRTASPRPLKLNALLTFQLGARAYRGMDYAQIDPPHGEIQVFHDYRRRVSATRSPDTRSSPN